MGGFVSMSKYGVLSSLRVTGQLFSFDILQNVLMCVVVTLFGTFSFEELVFVQVASGVFILFE